MSDDRTETWIEDLKWRYSPIVNLDAVDLDFGSIVCPEDVLLYPILITYSNYVERSVVFVHHINPALRWIRNYPMGLSQHFDVRDRQAAFNGRALSN